MALSPIRKVAGTESCIAVPPASAARMVSGALPSPRSCSCCQRARSAAGIGSAGRMKPGITPGAPPWSCCVCHLADKTRGAFGWRLSEMTAQLASRRVTRVPHRWRSCRRAGGRRRAASVAGAWSAVAWALGSTSPISPCCVISRRTSIRGEPCRSFSEARLPFRCMAIHAMVRRDGRSPAASPGAPGLV
jgi:hypothetical protein